MKLTPEKLTAFCAALAETGQVLKACAAVGISNYTAYQWRKTIPEFALSWDDALAASVTVLESEMARRASEGLDEPIVHHGQFTYLQDFDAINPDTGEKYTPAFAPVMRNADGTPKLATVKKYSDTLLIFSLKAANPSKYRENSRIELAGDGGGPIKYDDVSVANRLAKLLGAAEARKRAESDENPEDDLSDLL